MSNQLLTLYPCPPRPLHTTDTYTIYENQFQELNDNDPAAQCQLGRQEIAIGNRVNPSRPLDNGGKQKQLLYLVHYSNRLLSLSHLFLLANCLAALLLLCSYIHTLPTPPTRTGTTIIALSHRYTNTDSHAIRHQRLSSAECVSLLGSVLLPPVLG